MRPRLIVIGTAADPHVARVSGILESLGQEVVVLDYKKNTELTVSFDDPTAPAVAFAGTVLRPCDIVWDRLKLGMGTYGTALSFDRDAPGETRSATLRNNIVRMAEWNATYALLQTLHSGQIINGREARMALLKPNQLKAAAVLGFAVPPTIITTSRAGLMQFCARHPSVIAKPQSGALQALGETPDDDPTIIMTMRLTRDDLDALTDDDLYAAPFLAQREIEKQHELRVFACGDEVVAFRIDSQERSLTRVDWRYGNAFLRFEEAPLDAALERKITSFLARFGLCYGSFDFVVDPAGEHWFLECNADGQWGFLESEPELKLSNILARELAARLQAASA